MVVAAEPADLDGCEVAFVAGPSAAVALRSGVDDVLALSCSPLGAPLRDLPEGAADYAREVPGYADHWGGPVPTRLDVVAGGGVLPPLPELALGTDDRVLAAVPLADPASLAALLAVLRCGAALVLAPAPDRLDLARIVAQEGVTWTLGAPVDGVPHLPD